MTSINQSRSTIEETLLLLEINKPSLAQPKPMAKNNCLVFFFGLWLLTGYKTAIAQEELVQLLKPLVKSEALRVNLQENRLSIEAKQVPWQQLLTMLEEKTQVSIQSARPIESTVTVSIPALPITEALQQFTEALQQLFNHRFDSVFLLSEQKAPNSVAPKSVWLLGNAINVAKASSHSVEKTSDMPKPTPDKAAVDNESMLDGNEHETVQELADKARNAENPELRIQALASLSGRQEHADNSDEKLALETTLTIRRRACGNMQCKPWPARGDAATEYLREALDDPDAGVRMKAVESVAPEGQGIALLQEALSNPDELVQTMAEERLKQVNQ
jgi:hypothetical protein